MKSIVYSLAILLAAAPAPLLAQEPSPHGTAPLSLQHRMLLRCSAAFALGAHAQASGDQRAAGWPSLAEEGREFFVRASAQVMDEAGLDRTQIAAALAQEAGGLAQDGALVALMPACLALLPARAP